MTLNRNLIWTDDHIEQLRKFAETGGSATRAAAKFKRSRSAVISVAQRHGFKFAIPKRLAFEDRLTAQSGMAHMVHGNPGARKSKL